MPNIRRTFPGSSRSYADDDDEVDETPVYRGGGKQLAAGGKGFRPQEHNDDDDNDSDDDDSDASEEPQTYSVVNRGSGKQLGGGKYLRPSHDDDEDDDDDDDANAESEDDDEDDDEVQPEQQQPIRVMPRGGGKNFIRPMVQEESDEEDSDEEEEEEEEEPPPQKYTAVVNRGGGKSLMKPAVESEESDDDDDEEMDEPVKPTQVNTAIPHGKQIRRPEPQDEEEAPPPATTIMHHGGKQLRRPPEPEKEPTKTTISQTIQTGKKLRMPEPDDDDDEADDDDEEEEEEEEDKPLKAEPEPEPVKPIMTKPIVGGKQLHRGGKQLHRPAKDDDEEEEDDDDEDEEEASFDSDDDDEDDDEEYEDNKKGKAKAKDKSEEDEEYQETKGKAKAKTQPKRASPKAAKAKASKAKEKKEPAKKEPAKKEPAKKEPAKKEPAKKEPNKKKVVLEEPEEIFGDDDVSSDEEAELDMNNAEGLIKDEADQKYLDSLPELEREAILAERFEKLKAEQDMKIAMREAKRKEDEAKGKSKDDKPKEKPYTDMDEDLAKSLAGRRSSVRERDATGAKSKKQAALAALKKERKIQQDVEESSGDSEMDFGDDDEDSDEDYDEGAGLKPWQKKTKPGAVGKPSVSRLDQSDESGEDMDIDDDDDEPQSKVVRKGKAAVDADKSALEAGLDDFIKVTIPRRRLERWCNEPFFEAAVLECFVRVFIGEDENGEKVYRLCEIVDVKNTQKSFKFPVSEENKKPVSTNKMLRLKFGNSEKDFPMSFVSDVIPTESDVQKYITNQKNNRLEVLAKRRATKLRRLQDELVGNYTYTTEDIEKNLQRRKKLGKIITNLGSETTRVAIAVQGAKEAVAEAEQRLVEAKKALMESSNPAEETQLENAVHDCTDALKAAKKNLELKIEEEKATLATVEDRKRRLAQREKDLNWAKVNERALMANQQADREGYQAQKAAELSRIPGKKDEFNPYARRRVKPKVLWKVGKALMEEDDTKGEEKKESKEEIIIKVEESSMDVQTPSLVQETYKAVALSESHQFAIDEEGLVQSSTLASLGLGGKRVTRKRQRVRQGLSLEKYMQLKGQGAL